jgi:hypothetical protein
MNDEKNRLEMMSKETSSLLGRIKIYFSTSRNTLVLLMIGEKKPKFSHRNQSNFFGKNMSISKEGNFQNVKNYFF